MPSFAIIAEGVTDQIVLESILKGFFTVDGEEPRVDPVQPPPKLDSKSDPPPGGWTLVFRSLAAGEHKKALQFNDYLILHLDSDVSEDKGFDVPHREDGRELTVPELFERIVKKLKVAMGAEFIERYGDRLLFAIAIHGIECWLLPLIYNDNHAGKITGCLSAMNEARRKANKSSLSKGDGSKDPRAYQETSRDFRKRKVLAAAIDRNPSLKIFVDSLGALPPGARPEQPTT